MIIETNQACDLVIFGAKGDLTKRKLLPALYKLEKSKKIHKYTRIIATGRADWSTQDYIRIVKIEIKKFLNEEIDNLIWEQLSSRIFFCNIDVYEPLHFFKLKEILHQKKKYNCLLLCSSS